jgi:hypothetical protein
VGLAATLVADVHRRRLRRRLVLLLETPDLPASHLISDSSADFSYENISSNASLPIHARLVDPGSALAGMRQSCTRVRSPSSGWRITTNVNFVSPPRRAASVDRNSPGA